MNGKTEDVVYIINDRVPITGGDKFFKELELPLEENSTLSIAARNSVGFSTHISSVKIFPERTGKCLYNLFFYFWSKLFSQYF